MVPMLAVIYDSDDDGVLLMNCMVMTSAMYDDGRRWIVWVYMLMIRDARSMTELLTAIMYDYCDNCCDG